MRGLTATKTYEAFVGQEKLTPENLKLAGVLGVTMEMVGNIRSPLESCLMSFSCSPKHGSWP